MVSVIVRPFLSKIPTYPFHWLVRESEEWGLHIHYNDVIMSAMASQISSLTIVYSTVYSGANQGKHQSSASLAFVRGIHRWPVISPHKWPVTRKKVSIWWRHHVSAMASDQLSMQAARLIMPSLLASPCHQQSWYWQYRIYSPLDKMAAISQTTFLSVFSWMEMLEFRLKFRWNLFLRVHLKISQYWLR